MNQIERIFLGVPIQITGVDTKKIYEKIYELTPEIYKALSDTGYTGENFLMVNNIIRDLGYTGREDRDSKTKTFFTITLPKLVEENQNKTFDEITNSSDDLQGEGLNIIVPSNIFGIYTRLEALLGLNFPGRSDTLTEASNLIDKL